MRVYILTDADFELLNTQLSVDAKHKKIIQIAEQQKAYEDAYRYYNYIARRWIDNMKEPQK